jgi:hypothetical protein
MIFKILAVLVTADAFDRHQREKQHQAWIDVDRRTPGEQARADTRMTTGAWDLTAPERPS